MSKEYLRAWRAKNPDYYKNPEQRKRRNDNLRKWREEHPGYFTEASRKTRAAKRAHLMRVKESRGCQDCGEKDPIVLEFDHRDPAQKNIQLNPRVSGKGGWVWLSWKDLITEIDKCDVVCANCHRRRTAAMQGWLDYDGLMALAGRKEGDHGEINNSGIR